MVPMQTPCKPDRRNPVISSNASPLHRLSARLLLLFVGSLVCAATGAVAAETPAAYYRATLEKPSAPHEIISSDVLWYGHDNVLEASAASDIDKRVCAVLAHNVGPVTAFSAAGKPLSSDELVYCNQHARKSK